ncbi:MAG TPA: hypothetical protein P5525_25035 [Candidatus Paceibacterota bacterium]|nr:hypothetical protein [Candidatus Paceibacterota bacterium]
MIAASPTTSLRAHAQRNPRRSLDLITGPLDEIARDSASFIAGEPVRFDLAGQTHALPRYMFIGPQGGAEPMRIGLFAGIHGDEPAASFALLRFVRWLEEAPEIARGYCLFLYPTAPRVCCARRRHSSRVRLK